MIILKDIAILSIYGYRYFYNKAFLDNKDVDFNYVDDYLEAEEYLNDKIFSILKEEDKLRVSFLIPGFNKEEVDKRIDDLNNIINSCDEYNITYNNYEFSSFEEKLLMAGYNSLNDNNDIRR